LWPVEGVVNVLDQPASRGDFLAGQTFTAGDVYVGSHLLFDLPHRQKQHAASRTFSSFPRATLNERSESRVV